MTTRKNTIQSVASEICSNLEVRKRANGDKYVCQKDPSKQWITDIIYKAHQDRLPCDDIYNVIYEVVQLLSEAATNITKDEARDILYEIEPPIYTYEITKWLNNNNSNIDYLTQVIDETEAKLGGFELLAWAYSKFQLEIADIILREILIQLNKAPWEVAK